MQHVLLQHVSAKAGLDLPIPLSGGCTPETPDRHVAASCAPDMPGASLSVTSATVDTVSTSVALQNTIVACSSEHEKKMSPEGTCPAAGGRWVNCTVGELVACMSWLQRSQAHHCLLLVTPVPGAQHVHAPCCYSCSRRLHAAAMQCACNASEES